MNARAPRRASTSSFFAFAAFAAFGALCGCQGCGSAPLKPNVEHALGFDVPDTLTDVRKVWARRLDGLMTDLSVASRSGTITVLTVVDPDSGIGHNALLRYRKDGRLMWHKHLDAQGRSEATASDGSLTVVGTYEAQLLGFDARGAIRWKADGMCRPVMLERTHRVLCYHDDDAAPAVAFDLFDWGGKLLASYPIHHDVLSLKVSADERYAVVGLTGGRVEVVELGDVPQLKWGAQVDGEVADAAASSTLSSGGAPHLAVLYDSAIDNAHGGERDKKRLSFFEAPGVPFASVAPDGHAGQVEVSAEGDAVSVYGNGAQGQYLGFYDWPAQPVLEPGALPERWVRGQAHYADYTPLLRMTSELAIVGYEDVDETTRHSHLVAFGRNGAIRWNIPFTTDEGSYLYAEGLSSGASIVVVGADDGWLSAYAVPDAASLRAER